MTDLERRALLGDKQAQEDYTERGIALPCPFCGSKAEYDTHSVGVNGDMRSWRFSICCSKCSARTPKVDYYISAKLGKDGNIHICNDDRKNALADWNTRNRGLVE